MMLVMNIENQVVVNTNMNSLIINSKAAMESVRSVLNHANIDFSSMNDDDMVNRSRSISAPCKHEYDRPYKGHGIRKCIKCGGLQSN